MNPLIRLIAPWLLLAGILRAGSEQWGELRTGMTSEAALALLGAPLVQSRGNGSEIWIYENGGEVLVSGKVINWTTPRSMPPPSPKVLPPAAKAPQEPEKLPVTVASAPKPVAATKSEVIRLLRLGGKDSPPRVAGADRAGSSATALPAPASP